MECWWCFRYPCFQEVSKKNSRKLGRQLRSVNPDSNSMMISHTIDSLRNFHLEEVLFTIKVWKFIRYNVLILYRENS